jgi:hypothetical protein
MEYGQNTKKLALSPRISGLIVILLSCVALPASAASLPTNTTLTMRLGPDFSGQRRWNVPRGCLECTDGHQLLRSQLETSTGMVSPT